MTIAIGADGAPLIAGFRNAALAIRLDGDLAGGVVDGAPLYPCRIQQLARAVVAHTDDRVALGDHQFGVVLHILIKGIPAHRDHSWGQVLLGQLQGDRPVRVAGRVVKALGVRVAVLVNNLVLLAAIRQGCHPQGQIAGHIIDGAGGIAGQLARPVVDGGFGRATGLPGQGQAVGGDPLMGQLMGQLHRIQHHAGAVEVRDLGTPAEHDRAVHIRQRPQGQHHRAGGEVEQARAIGFVLAKQLPAPVVFQVVPFALGQIADGQRTGARGGQQGRGIGIAPVVGGDLDLGRVSDARWHHCRAKAHGFAGCTVVRALAVEGQQASPVVDSPHHGTDQEQLAPLVGDHRRTDGDRYAARHGTNPQEQPLTGADW